MRLIQGLDFANLRLIVEEYNSLHCLLPKL